MTSKKFRNSDRQEISFFVKQSALRTTLGRLITEFPPIPIEFKINNSSAFYSGSLTFGIENIF